MPRCALIAFLSLLVMPIRAADRPVGLWRAWLDSPGGQLPFGLELADADGATSAWLINGAERIEVPRVSLDGPTLVLDIDYYDSKITATLSPDGTKLDGMWVKRASGGGWTKMSFHATAGKASRFSREKPAAESATKHRVGGRWSVTFAGSDDPAVALFEHQPDGTVTGTVMTTTGDYRYLAGNLEGDRLRLSCFDGAHAFLFDARVLADGSLRGDFWSRDTWHEAWTARRDETAKLPDAFAMTTWNSDRSPDELFFPDLSGRLRSFNDPAFQGKARIVVVFGTWCPNCHDASTYLVELQRRYGPHGLKVLGLAFELTGEFARDAQQVRTYVKRHGITYPVLVAGVSDKKKASAALPVLDRLRAYPTTIFLDAAGKVHAVHTGFSGPATGEAHQKLRAKFEGLIEEMLAP